MKGCLSIVFGSVIIGFIGIAIIFGILIFESSGEKEKEEPSIVQKETLSELEKAELDSLSKVNYNKDVAALKALKDKFVYKVDEFKNIGWYSHKTWGRHWLNRNGLVCNVNDEGYIYLESNYHGDEWIFHNKVIVKIGDVVLSSAYVPTYSNNHLSDNNYNGVYEINQYINGGDYGIIPRIAFHANETIKVRFEGEQKVKDFILNSYDKKAIADCYKLSQLIESVNYYQKKNNIIQ